ncbi:MAG: PBSX family phage terminase large subunit [Oscillospiraceae bacterium]|jgi:PBSX family phage terminase large subunit|nr:PBSX family phage terminase large subunit [Oscillospiraceae bacterium]
MKRLPNNKRISHYSPKQKRVLSWWMPQSKDHDLAGIICDGAVRSGKTLAMTVSFITWASMRFSGTSFAICGKTIASIRRNVIEPCVPQLCEIGFACEEKRSRNLIEITFAGHTNRFYLFGGKDEGSASLIQGMTLGGVMFDEVALMARSFVEQAIARCSLDGSRLWFNCNPAYPKHWFFVDWITESEQKKMLYLHFTMDDNPGLSEATRARYRSLYSGVFYTRFVEGKWIAADGLVYPMFAEEKHVTQNPPLVCEQYCVSCDYGTVNPSSFGLWGKDGSRWVRLDEYYWDSRKQGVQRTDEEHYAALKSLAAGREIGLVICDPSAASFLECIRRHGTFRVQPAQNDVVYGIRKVADALQREKIIFSSQCKNSIREFGQYRWEEGGGKDAPRKEHDHAMDDIRYFVVGIQAREDDGDGFFAGGIARIERSSPQTRGVPDAGF